MSCVDVVLVLAPVCNTSLPPLGLAYLAESLNKSGQKVICCDLNNLLFKSAKHYQTVWNIQYNVTLQKELCEKEIYEANPIIKQFLSDIGSLKPTIVSFSLYKNNYYPTFSLIKLLKKRCPHSTVVCGGPEVQACIERGEQIFADYWVCGEGEYVLGELARQLKEGIAIEKGMFDCKRTKEVYEDIPFPTFNYLDHNAYRHKRALPILMSRGCIRSCAFCSERLLYDGFRTRSAMQVVEEMRYHVLTYGVRQFVFYDSLINGNLKELELLCDVLIKENMLISWEAQCVIRTDMSVGLLKKMKRSGCYNLFIGLESGADSVLHRMNKGFSTNEARFFFTMLRQAQLHFEISLITDFIGETEEEFEETQRFICNNRAIIPKIAQLNPFIPYEGTEAKRVIDEEVNGRLREQRRESKMKRLVKTFEGCDIPYTKSYIGNLLPK